MSAGAAIAASVAARHRLRRVRRSPLRLVLVRLARPPARVSIEHRTAVAGARLQLVVSPTFALSRTVVAGAPAPAAAPIARAVTAPRAGVLEAHRLVERVVRLVERREAVLAPAAPAMVPTAPAPARSAPALRRDLVLAKPPPAPAVAAAAQPTTARVARELAATQPAGPASPAAADLTAPHRSRAREDRPPHRRRARAQGARLMAGLERATITDTVSGSRVTVLFNPEEYTVNRDTTFAQLRRPRALRAGGPVRPRQRPDARDGAAGRLLRGVVAGAGGLGRARADPEGRRPDGHRRRRCMPRRP